MADLDHLAAALVAEANAKLHGARGVILVNDTAYHPQDPNPFEKFGATAGPDNAGIFFVQISPSEADRWLALNAKNIKLLQKEIDDAKGPQSFAMSNLLRIGMMIDIERQQATVHNVVGYLPGATDEYVVIGAHYDHLGLGDAHSLAPSQVGTAHPGADDNASGTAGLLELARYFSKQPKPKRGILFVAFAGEELGLLGSNYYVNHPSLPLEKAAAMINLDMIGRMRDSKIYLAGSGTGTTFTKLLDDVKAKHTLSVDLSEKAGYGSSDHTSFTSKQVPVLFFFSGLHADYHKPSDTWEKIDGPAATKLLSMIADIGDSLANAPERPTFVAVASSMPMSGVGGNRGYGAYFGSIPDMAEQATGVKFADVREGSPAAKAGLKAGDVMIEFDGKPVQNLSDFSYVLRSKKPGDEVLVKVVRNGSQIVAKVLLSTRN